MCGKTLDLTNDIPKAAEILKTGGIVAVPTETVYGLAVNAADEKAVMKLFSLKGRSENKPISVMVSGLEGIDALCRDVPKDAYELAEAFWPGPLTIVLKAKEGLSDALRAGGTTVGLRCPAHDKTLELLKAAAIPLAVPSANPSGKPSPVNISQVLEYFDGEIEGYICGGECTLGQESTVIDMSRTPYKILRQGAASEFEIGMALAASLTIIGITGGTGSGKTTALDTLRSMGALVLDSDAVYHELLSSSKSLREAIDRAFPGALPQGELSTKALGELVFSDPQALSNLNAITHRFVGEEMMRRLSDWAFSGGSVAAIDAIALIESGISAFCKATVGITAPTKERLERIMRREGISREYASLRIEAQKSNEYFREKCDYTIENDTTIEHFAEKCRQTFSDILKKQ